MCGVYVCVCVRARARVKHGIISQLKKYCSQIWELKIIVKYRWLFGVFFLLLYSSFICLLLWVRRLLCSVSKQADLCKEKTTLFEKGGRGQGGGG